MKENLRNRRNAQRLRREQTKEENHLWYDFLKTYPIQFRRQYPIDIYYVDFFCYQAGLIVELDGSQHYRARDKAYDQVRTEFLETLGYQVLRFPNLDIWNNFRGVCERIDETVKQRLAEK